ncbi:MAG: glycine--tRNA ligase subunit beta [Pseudohongiellaceae bacterium]
MASNDFIVELGCAELPPGALRTLSDAFLSGVRDGLDKAGLRYSDARAYATPRRLAVQVDGLQERQADADIEKFGPAVKAAYDADGNPTKAAEGFARSCGVALDALDRDEKDGVEKLVYRSTRQGEATTDLLPGIVDQALSRLPIPRKMRWGSRREEFVRPVYWVLMLFGEAVVKARILGIEAGNQTRGHRFHHPDPITIERPADYAGALEAAYVLADPERRKARIREQVEAEAARREARVVIENDLLNEVSALVEWPVALTGRFDEHFLKVPAEALISSLKQHQKCFYLLDANGAMLPYFIAVSNIESRDPAQVVAGNERVIRPRLADASFFYEMDSKRTLESHRKQLKQIVFQQQLGTVYEKSERVAALAASIATQLGGDADRAQRAAQLAKCDLVTRMVSEFADLQGIMGSYYARNDGEPEDVAAALNEQYMPRFSGDRLPDTLTGAALAIAEKLDTITGLFAIDQPPTGSKDPFALRRAALGVLRIIIGKELDLDLRVSIRAAVDALPETVLEAGREQIAERVFDFMLDRFRAWYQAEGVPHNVFQSVFELRPSRPVDFDRRIQAVRRFSELPECEALAAANKRVANILQKQGTAATGSIQDGLLQEPAEQQLSASVGALQGEVEPLFAAGDYTAGLEKLAGIREPVDRFFDEVLVMADDEALRANRLALLAGLRQLFLQAADISCLHQA